MSRRSAAAISSEIGEGISGSPYSWPSAAVAADVLSRAGALSDVIVGNDEEFGFMAGHIDKGLDKARELATTSAQIVVYKMGQNGAVTFADGVEIPTGIYPVDAIKLLKHIVILKFRL